MSKFGLQIDKTYRPGERDVGIRRIVRNSLHPPEKRATTKTLFVIGVVTLAVAVGGLLGLHR